MTSVNADIKKCPFIIITSATIDPYKYANYFKTKTIFEVKGLTFPIENNFLKVNCSNYKSMEFQNVLTNFSSNFLTFFNWIWKI